MFFSEQQQSCTRSLLGEGPGEGLVVSGLSHLTSSPSKGRGLNSDQVKEDAVINALNSSMEDSCSAPCFFK